MLQLSARTLVHGTGFHGPVLATDTPLSLWGGLDLEGTVCDQHHPLQGQSVTDTVWILPGGRGSCTASQVLLEVIRNGVAPSAIVLRDADALLCVGALVAWQVLEIKDIPTIVVLDDGFEYLLKYTKENPSAHAVLSGGQVHCYPNRTSVVEMGACDGEQRDELHLTERESHLMNQASSEAEKQSLYVLFHYARITQAQEYLPVTSAHIDGCTYIGPGGLEFAQQLVEKGGRVKIPTTLNSISTDRRQTLGMSNDDAAQQLADAYVALDCQETYTCAPYLLRDPPTEQENWVWGESNAVVYVNSMWGVRTNKTADYLDICAAIAGIIPADGMYVQREPEIVLQVDDSISTDHDADMAALGHLCGSSSDGKILLVLGLEDRNLNDDHWKAFCAAFGTTGAAPLIHVAGVTPEACSENENQERLARIKERRVLTREDITRTWSQLDNDGDTDKVDLIALGNPHLSVKEIQKLANLTEGLSKHPDTRVVTCMSRAVQEQASTDVESMKSFGIEVINDTCWCMLLEPPVIPANTAATIMTNSGKYAHYGPGLVNRRFRFGNLADCIKAAHTGRFQRSFHAWAHHMRCATKFMVK